MRKSDFTFSFVLGDFLQHVREVNDHTVAEQSDAVGKDHSGGQQVEGEVGVADDNGVSCIVAACAPCNNVHTLWCEQVDKLAWDWIVIYANDKTV